MSHSPDLPDQNQYFDKISSVTSTMGLQLSSDQVLKLLQFVNLLWKWNKAYNLTSIRDYGQIFPTHLWDSLVLSDYIEAGTCLDIAQVRACLAFLLR